MAPGGGCVSGKPQAVAAERGRALWLPGAASHRDCREWLPRVAAESGQPRWLPGVGVSPQLYGES